MLVKALLRSANNSTQDHRLVGTLGTDNWSCSAALLHNATLFSIALGPLRGPICYATQCCLGALRAPFSNTIQRHSWAKQRHITSPWGPIQR